jgi:branched-chain amino acid transport system substrate-binding protein
MTPIVLKVKSLNPDAVISVVYFEVGVLLHRARFNLNYDGPIWLGGASGFSDDKLWNVLGDEVAQKTLTRSFGLAFYSADANLPGLKSVLERAGRAAPDQVIDQGFMTGAQAAILVVRALEAAGSTEPKAVNEALRKLTLPARSPDIILPFITGDFSFDKDGVPQGATPLFVQWRDRRKVIVFPEAVATAAPLLK